MSKSVCVILSRGPANGIYTFIHTSDFFIDNEYRIQSRRNFHITAVKSPYDDVSNHFPFIMKELVIGRIYQIFYENTDEFLKKINSCNSFAYMLSLGVNLKYRLTFMLTENISYTSLLFPIKIISQYNHLFTNIRQLSLTMDNNGMYLIFKMSTSEIKDNQISFVNLKCDTIPTLNDLGDTQQSPIPRIEHLNRTRRNELNSSDPTNMIFTIRIGSSFSMRKGSLFYVDYLRGYINSYEQYGTISRSSEKGLLSQGYFNKYEVLSNRPDRSLLVYFKNVVDHHSLNFDNNGKSPLFYLDKAKSTITGMYALDTTTDYISIKFVKNISINVPVFNLFLDEFVLFYGLQKYPLYNTIIPHTIYKNDQVYTEINGALQDIDKSLDLLYLGSTLEHMLSFMLLTDIIYINQLESFYAEIVPDPRSTKDIVLLGNNPTFVTLEDNFLVIYNRNTDVGTMMLRIKIKDPDKSYRLNVNIGNKYSSKNTFILDKNSPSVIFLECEFLKDTLNFGTIIYINFFSNK